MILEVPCGNIESVHAAFLGGADRIELCSALPLGGLTPAVEMFEAVAGNSGKIVVMIRPREGDFIYSPEEFRVMLRTIEYFKNAGANGIVSGVLLKNGMLDKDRCRELIEASDPLSFTFHRAFDLTADPFHTLDDLIDLKADRILTSGQAADAWNGRELISKLVMRSEGKINIIAGAGINIVNVVSICEATGVSEVHLSGRIKKKSPMTNLQRMVSLGNNSDDDNDYHITDTAIIRTIRNLIDKKHY